MGNASDSEYCKTCEHSKNITDMFKWCNKFTAEPLACFAHTVHMGTDLINDNNELIKDSG